MIQQYLEACVLFLNLTRGESRMKVRLTTLPDTLSGAAWPSSVRAVKIFSKEKVSAKVSR